MKTNTRELLHRFDGLFGSNWNKIKDASSSLSDQVRDQAGELGQKAGEQWVEGKKAILSAEQCLVESVRKNPTLYVGIAVGIAATVAAGILIARLRRAR